MTKIKICGIKTYDDAKKALDLGADALGFNFVKRSPRYLSPADAQVIVRRLPPSAWYTGVFFNASREEVLDIARLVPLDTLQFHGEETPEYCTDWNEWRVIKSFRIGAGGPDLDIAAYAAADFFLFDSYTSKVPGGTGELIPDELLPAFETHLAKSFLAGGLRPENVAARVESFKPFGVDVASGVESAPGKKDPDLMESFVAAVRDRS